MVAHVLKRCASVLDAVVTFSFELGAVLLLVQLTGVEAVPNVIHLMVQLVGVAGFLICDPDWSNVTVLPIVIITNEHKLADIFVRARPCIPCLFELTILIGLRDTCNIRNNLEISIPIERLWITRVARAFKEEDDIPGGSAWEANAVINIVPFFWRVHQVSHCIIVHIVEFSVEEVLRRVEIRFILV